MTEAAVRSLVRQAHQEARGDGNDLILALDRRVRDAWGDFQSFPPFVVQRDDLHVTIAGPYMTFRRSLIDALRTKRRLDQVPWVNAVVVDVEPLRLGAPDIESVSLSRAGGAIGPLRPGLRPMTFTNGAGATGVMHAGAIHFPPSAFAPGQVVALTLRVAAGEPIVHTFDAETLQTLK